jgi:hypothetical protein
MLFRKKWANILTLSFLALAIFIGAWIILSDVFHPAVQDKGNPFEYDVTAFTKTNPRLVCYDESGKINLDLLEPKGIAVDPQDNIYVTGDQILVSYRPDGTKRFQADLNETANCLACGPDKKIYLGMRNHIEILDQSGKPIAVWTPIDSQSVITSIAVAPRYVFIADAGQRLVWRYNLDGQARKKIAEKDSAQGIPGLIIPSPYCDVAIDPDGYLWVANTGRHAFENYTMDGQLRSRWERISMTVDGFCGCCNPTHFALLPDGSFVTSEKGIARVKIHKPTGEFSCVVAGPEQFDDGTVGLDLAVDSQERVLVLDPHRKMVRIFIKKV